ncbi:NUDIX domain-containing protein [Actinoplanes sp. NPDC051470]|uniref:NUDIX domain-containing protein n=1 Tax=unclassified Actinoplanes TaxID=2626549 RepID=UPI003435CBBB
MKVLQQGVSVFVVNSAGWVLLQHRDENAPTCPDMWCLPGGAVEPGEEPAAAAGREVLKEAGLDVAGSLRPLFSGHITETLEAGTGTPYLEHTFAATTPRDDSDVRLGEGRDMRFLPVDVIMGLDLAPSTRHFFAIYLALGAHEEVTSTAGSGAAAPGGSRPTGRAG